MGGACLDARHRDGASVPTPRCLGGRCVAVGSKADPQASSGPPAQHCKLQRPGAVLLLKLPRPPQAQAQQVSFLSGNRSWLDSASREVKAGGRGARRGQTRSPVGQPRSSGAASPCPMLWGVSGLGEQPQHPCAPAVWCTSPSTAWPPQGELLCLRKEVTATSWALL